MSLKLTFLSLHRRSTSGEWKCQSEGTAHFPQPVPCPVLHWQRSRGKHSQHRVPCERSTNTGSEMPGMWNSPSLRYAFPPVTTNSKMQQTASNRDQIREWIPCDTRRMTQLCLFQQCLDGKSQRREPKPWNADQKKDKSGWPWNVPRVYSYYCWWLYGTYCMPGAVLTTSHIDPFTPHQNLWVRY